MGEFRDRFLVAIFLRSLSRSLSLSACNRSQFRSIVKCPRFRLPVGSQCRISAGRVTDFDVPDIDKQQTTDSFI